MKIKLLSLSLMCAVSLFAVEWYDVETQADVENVNVNVKATAQAILNVKLTPGYPFNSYAELKENAKTALKPVNQNEWYSKAIVFWMVSHTNGLKIYSQDLLNDADPAIKNLIIRFISKYICPNFTKEQKNEFIKNNIVDAVAGKSANAIKKNDFRQMLDYYVKNIMPVIAETEAKKTLKTLNKYIYPLIGEDAEMKDLAVKIKLALESLE